jgi:hypothetical protein
MVAVGLTLLYRKQLLKAGNFVDWNNAEYKAFLPRCASCVHNKLQTVLQDSSFPAWQQLLSAA